MIALRVLNDGHPAVVKLLNGQEVIGVLYADDDDDGVIIEYPMIATVVKYQQPDNEGNVTVKYGTRFDKWIALSEDKMVPLTMENIVAMAVASDEASQAFFEWAIINYKLVQPKEADSEGAENAESPDEPDAPVTEQRKNAEDIRQEILYRRLLNSISDDSIKH